MHHFHRSPKRRRLALALLLLAACDRAPEEASPEVQAARAEARSQACLSAELARTAEDDLATLQATTGSSEPITAAVARQAAAYAQAFLQHAQLRVLSYAQIDSAFNHSSSEADSLRHTEAAAEIAIVAPEPGTVEANVIADYQRRFETLLADADHPCNWNLEEEGAEAGR